MSSFAVRKFEDGHLYCSVEDLIHELTRFAERLDQDAERLQKRKGRGYAVQPQYAASVLRDFRDSIQVAVDAFPVI